MQGVVADNINNHVELEEEDVYALDDNRAAVGKQVQVTTDYEKDAGLELHFDCSAAGQDPALLMICKYEDGEMIPFDTHRDDTALWTNVSTGIYFVINAETLLGHLDIPVDEYKSLVFPASTTFMKLGNKEEAVVAESSSNEVDTEWLEENYTSVDKEGIPVEENETDEDHKVLTSSLYPTMKLADKVGSTTTGKISGQADIVFVIDSTGSMSDVNSFKSHVDSIYVNGGGDGPETPIDGLAMAHSLIQAN